MNILYCDIMLHMEYLHHLTWRVTAHNNYKTIKRDTYFYLLREDRKNSS